MGKIISKLKVVGVLFMLCLGCLLGAAAGLTGIYLYLSPSLPAVDELIDVELQTPLRVYSIDNKLIGEFGEKRRNPVSFEQVPPVLVDAILAAEDDGFYEHNGVSIKSLARASSQLVVSGEIQSGGSTITMQVARNFFLTLEQTFSRKFNEILLALKIERALSKEQILELYINKIFLGNRAYGFEAAAIAYYGQSLKDLTLPQIAMIAGLPKAPSAYNPLANPSRALVRRDWILNRMLTLGMIDQPSFEQAVAAPVTAKARGQNLDLYAPYIAEIAREKAVELYGDQAYTHGYKVFTTVDSKLQLSAQEAVVNGLLAYDGRHGYRGPEQTLNVDLLKSLDAVDNEELSEVAQQGDALVEESLQNESIGGEQRLGSVNLLPWLDALGDITTYSGLRPAAVIKIGEESISAILASGEAVEILWENGIEQARKFIDENAQGKEPATPADVVSLGDVIRIYQDSEGVWFFSQVPQAQAGIVAVSPIDGSITSMVGGFDFQQSSFNRMTQAKRQPGSNFKPFVYTAALEKDLTAASVMNDAPIVIEDEQLESVWRPENASGKFGGPTPLRKALYQSKNLVSIRVLRHLGIGSTIRSMERFGMDTKEIPRDLSMALGSHVMSPLEVATAYAVFANGGYKVDPYLVHHVKDRFDEVIYKAEPKVVPNQTALAFDDESVIDNIDSDNVNDESIEAGILVANTEGEMVESDLAVTLETVAAERVVDGRIAYIMNSILGDVVKRGTATRAKALSRNDLAGKTGTTNGPTDAWFSGYNHHLVATTWVGFDDNQMLGRREYGGSAALPIWIDYMRTALDGVPEKVIAQPNGVVTVRIDPETGERAAPDNPDGIFELFLAEKVPPERLFFEGPGGSEGFVEDVEELF